MWVGCGAPAPASGPAHPSSEPAAEAAPATDVEAPPPEAAARPVDWRGPVIQELGRLARARPERLAALRELIERADPMSAAERDFAERALALRERSAAGEGWDDEPYARDTYALFAEYAGLYPTDVAVQCEIASVFVFSRDLLPSLAAETAARVRALGEQFPQAPCTHAVRGLACQLADEDPLVCLRHYRACAALDPSHACAQEAARRAAVYVQRRCATADIDRAVSVVILTPVDEYDAPGPIEYEGRTFTPSRENVRRRDIAEVREGLQAGEVTIALTPAGAERFRSLTATAEENGLWFGLQAGDALLYAEPLIAAYESGPLHGSGAPIERLCARTSHPELPEDLRAP